MELFGVTLGLGVLVASVIIAIPLGILLDAWVITLGARMTGTTELKGFGHALALAAGALVASIVIGMPLNCGLGCVVGSMSGGLSTLLGLVLSIFVRAAVFSSLLPADMGSAGALAFVSWLISTVIALVATMLGLAGVVAFAGAYSVFFA